MSQVWRIEPKGPSDERPVSIDWSPLFDSGETFSSGGVSLVDIRDRESGVDVTGTMFVAGSLGTSSNTAFFRVKAGSDNRDYVATLHVVTTKSRIDDGKVIIPVRARVRN